MKSTFELYDTTMGLTVEPGYHPVERGRMRPPFLYPVETKDTVWNITKGINCSSVIELAPSYEINTLIFRRRYV
jgi:hypothetical protein